MHLSSQWVEVFFNPFIVSLRPKLLHFLEITQVLNFLTYMKDNKNSADLSQTI